MNGLYYLLLGLIVYLLYLEAGIILTGLYDPPVHG